MNFKKSISAFIKELVSYVDMCAHAVFYLQFVALEDSIKNTFDKMTKVV